MRKITLILFLFGFVLNYGHCQNNPKTLLWKVTKANSNKISYLFGTFHQVNPDFFDSLAIATNYLKRSEILFVESYNSETAIDSNKITSEFNSWNKDKWKSKLKPSQFDIFEKFIKSEWGNEKIYSMPPIQLMFILQYIYFQGVCDTINRKSYEPMDDRITSIALSNKLIVVGLDENQLLDIKKSSEQDKALSLKNTIHINEQYMKYILEKNINNSTAKFLFDYKKFNLNYSLNKRSKALKVLLNDRNNKWMKKISNQFKMKNCFVAIGIRHLFYKTGLIQQLRQQGYKVEPIEI